MKRIYEAILDGREPFSPALVYFKNILDVPLAWQVCFDMPKSGINPADFAMSPL